MSMDTAKKSPDTAPEKTTIVVVSEPGAPLRVERVDLSYADREKLTTTATSLVGRILPLKG